MAFITIRQGQLESTVLCKKENVAEISKIWTRKGWKVEIEK